MIRRSFKVTQEAGFFSGKMSSGSCVFGVGDLANVLQQPHLVAHKLYIDFEPAAYFCGLKAIRLREGRPMELDISPYQELPQVELSAGVLLRQPYTPTMAFLATSTP
ncbi:hypothetical protein COOONC_10668 [Cooperia oncophora]